LLIYFDLALGLGQHQLVLGLNGSGKSSLLDALRALKTLVTGEAQPDLLFPYRQPNTLAEPAATDIRVTR
jgi:ABC-type molybdenum transport system ATPase subunit/photorepair protein PhrA